MSLCPICEIAAERTQTNDLRHFMCPCCNKFDIDAVSEDAIWRVSKDFRINTILPRMREFASAGCTPRVVASILSNGTVTSSVMPT